jgi:hypothetical protein
MLTESFTATSPWHCWMKACLFCLTAGGTSAHTDEQVEATIAAAERVIGIGAAQKLAKT